MKQELIAQLHASFEQLVHVEEETKVEFWLARDLQRVLGYDRWENFEKVVRKAITACDGSGYVVTDHFLETTKMVLLGSGAERPVLDYMLTRYACYLIAQNGDPSKDPIAFAQTYFAVQTRKQELIEARLSQMERLQARRKLTASEKELSGIIFERVGDGQSFGRIRSKGDQALFGGHSTQRMKDRLGVPESRPLADEIRNSSFGFHYPGWCGLLPGVPTMSLISRTQMLRKRTGLLWYCNFKGSLSGWAV
jgi:DNA-damage-inducible protein D